VNRRTAWRLVRLTAYLIVAILLFRSKAGVDWRHLVGRAPTTDTPANTVVIGGDDLAPGLVDRLLAPFLRDHPDLRTRREGGGTNRALERVINRESDLALTTRPPTATEQRLAEEATGDTLVVHRLALDAVVAWRAAAAPPTVVDPAGLRRLALEGPVGDMERLVVSDPNDGTWGAFLAIVAPGTPDSAAGPSVRFVADAGEVLAAVRADPGALGLTGWLAHPEPDRPPGVQAVPITGPAPGAAPVSATYEKIGTGEYPLVHTLHVVARPGGGVAAAMLLTYLVGDDGQRQIERAGYLPARRALRTVVLSTDPIGEKR
jgi:ABC-type phosphate transport system substrate-binding protein